MAGVEWSIADATKSGQPAVITMSLGMPHVSQALNNVVAEAVANDIVVVVAAGNDNKDACTSSPASAPGALTVGATTLADARSPFSNTGACVDLFAPGSSITGASIEGDLAVETMSGTSMACPHVAGAAAQLRGLHPTLGAAATADLLVCYATQGAIAEDSNWGGSPNTFLYAGVGIESYHEAIANGTNGSLVMSDCKPRPAKLDVKESGKPVVEFAVLAVPYTGLAGPGLAA